MSISPTTNVQSIFIWAVSPPNKLDLDFFITSILSTELACTYPRIQRLMHRGVSKLITSYVVFGMSVILYLRYNNYR